MAFYSFPGHPPIPAIRLPLTLISLEDWVLITLTGTDCETYLQSRVTIDIRNISEHQHRLAAHCNYKGKTWGAPRLFRRKNDFMLIERRSLRDIQLIEFKKYSIFSKVKITADDKHVLLGIAGFQARSALKNLFKTLPNAYIPLVNEAETSLLWFKYPTERFLLIGDIATVEHFKKVLCDKAQFNNSQQWLSLSIESGEPVIDLPNSGLFIPQAINLQLLDGIDFKKGCYVGQEIVARAKSRRANKRALFYLVGYADRIPNIGEYLEIKIGKGWRPTGTILASVRLDDSRLLVQAVLNKNIEVSSIFRVRDDLNSLSIAQLPYSLDEKNRILCKRNW